MLLVVLILPIAAYLFVLGRINRRPHPLVVSGPWDFAGILFAASGFLLVGGPALLDNLTFSESWRPFWLLAKPAEKTAPAADVGDARVIPQTSKLSDETDVADFLLRVRTILCVVYFIAIIAGAAYLLHRRRMLTAVYNVEAAQIETILGDTFERWQIRFVQTGNLLTFDPEAETLAVPPALSEGILAEGNLLQAAATRSIRLVERPTTLEVEASPRMCHVTMKWNPPDSPLRREVESQLRTGLATAPAPANQAGELLLLISGSLFFLCLAGMAAIVFIRLLHRA